VSKENGTSASPGLCPLSDFPASCERRFTSLEEKLRQADDVIDWTAQHVEALVIASGGKLKRKRPRLE